jgi:hypothetical protein
MNLREKAKEVIDDLLIGCGFRYSEVEVAKKRALIASFNLEVNRFRRSTETSESLEEK